MADPHDPPGVGDTDVVDHGGILRALIGVVIVLLLAAFVGCRMWATRGRDNMTDNRPTRGRHGGAGILGLAAFVWCFSRTAAGRRLPRRSPGLAAICSDATVRPPGRDLTRN